LLITQHLPIFLSFIPPSAVLMQSVQHFLQYCYYEDPQPYEKEGTAVSLYVLLILIFLECRRIYRSEVKNECIYISNLTFVMRSCQRIQLIHKRNFDRLLLDKRTIYCNILKPKFYRNTGHLQKHLPNTSHNDFFSQCKYQPATQLEKNINL